MTTDSEPPPLQLLPRRLVHPGDRLSHMSIEEIQAEVDLRQRFALERRRRRRTPVYVTLGRRVADTPDWAWALFVCAVIVAFLVWAMVSLP